MDFRPHNKRREQSYLTDIKNLLAKLFPIEAEPETYGVRLLGAASFIRKYAWQAAQRMVIGAYQSNARTWRQAAQQAMRGPEIYAALQNELQGPVGERMRELIEENAQLIGSLPSDIARTVTRRVAEAHGEGERFENNVRGLLAHVSLTRARLIARTETSKASSALTRARAEHLDLPWYVWETSGDERVRKSHRKLQGVLVPFNSPPSPERLAGEPSRLGNYNAGDAPNCRCYAAPLLRFDSIQWPHRVYHHGIVQRMNLFAFKAINRSNRQFLQEAA